MCQGTFSLSSLDDVLSLSTNSIWLMCVTFTSIVSSACVSVMRSLSVKPSSSDSSSDSLFHVSCEPEIWDKSQTSEATCGAEMIGTDNSNICLLFTAGVHLCSTAVWDGAGSDGEEQEDVRGCDQHQTGGQVAGQENLVSPRELCSLTWEHCAPAASRGRSHTEGEDPDWWSVGDSPERRKCALTFLTIYLMQLNLIEPWAQCTTGGWKTLQIWVTRLGGGDCLWCELF